MDSSQPLSIESFSYSWLINIKPSSFENLEGSLRASLDASDEAAFIEMDPWSTPSKRFLGDAHDFNFDFPNAQPSLALVHADELFSNGFVMPLFLNPSKMEAFDASDSVAAPLPSSLESSKAVLSTHRNHWPFLRRCRRFSKRILQKYMSCFTPLYRKVRDSDAARVRAVVVKSWGGSQQSSPRTTYSTGDWHDIDGSIYEAVLHCKKSFEK